MPSELIYGDTMPIDINIAWGAGSEYVQVAALHSDGITAMIVIVNEWLKAAELPLIDQAEMQKRLVGTNFEGAPAQFTGWHATLSERAKVNRMIAVLRRARDHAFGKDE